MGEGAIMGTGTKGVSNHLMEAVAGRNVSLRNREFKLQSLQLRHHRVIPDISAGMFKFYIKYKRNIWSFYSGTQIGNFVLTYTAHTISHFTKSRLRIDNGRRFLCPDDQN
ncbi:hypothetical protein GOODEAATRI_027728 [Goodea atripinnis]|uniref:Uncharacterized protein n=1 Tax=Goodea atripinnis TaxID=208336 RepID=A0ABV0PS89_9TELE